jgi:hypothetical protein
MFEADISPSSRCASVVSDDYSAGSIDDSSSMLPRLDRELQCANGMFGGRRLRGCGDGKFEGAVDWWTAQYVLRLLSGDER